MSVAREIANLLFGNVETAANLQYHTGVRFDEIEIEFEGQYNANSYEIDGQSYFVFYEKELMATAKEFHDGHVSDDNSENIIGEIIYLSDYFDVLNTELLWNKIKEYANKNYIDISNSPESDHEAIKWFIKNKIDDDNTDIFEIIDDNDIINYHAYTNSMVTDVDYAIDVITGYYGDLEYSGKLELDGISSSMVYIFMNSH